MMHTVLCVLWDDRILDTCFWKFLFGAPFHSALPGHPVVCCPSAWRTWPLFLRSSASEREGDSFRSNHSRLWRCLICSFGWFWLPRPLVDAEKSSCDEHWAMSGKMHRNRGKMSLKPSQRVVLCGWPFFILVGRPRQNVSIMSKFPIFHLKKWRFPLILYNWTDLSPPRSSSSAGRHCCWVVGRVWDPTWGDLDAHRGHDVLG